MDRNIKAAIKCLNEAKIQEGLAREYRIRCERQLAYIIGNDKTEGSKTLTVKGWKATATNKLSRKLDHDQYKHHLASIPPEMHFVEYQPKINLKQLRRFEKYNPDLAAKIVTTKAAKTSIAVKETD